MSSSLRSFWSTVAVLVLFAPTLFGQDEQQPKFLALVDFANGYSGGQRLLVQQEKRVIIDYPGRPGPKNSIGRLRSDPMQPEQAIQLLSKFAALGQVFADANNTRVRIVLRDAANLDPQQIRNAISLAAEDAPKSTLFVTERTTPGKPISHELTTVDAKDALLNRWSQFEKRRGVRFLAYKNTVICRVGLEHPLDMQRALLSKADARNQVDKFLKQREIRQIPTDLSRSYTNEMDALFAQLQTSGAMNDRFFVYDTAWHEQIKPLLVSNQQQPLLLASIGAFNANVSKATSPDKCTVYITGSKGSGASVEYGTPSNADNGNWSDAGGLTMTSLELDYGSYRFRLLRNNKETGTTKKVKCESPSRGVEISE
jgi:hypothetical protein